MSSLRFIFAAVLLIFIWVSPVFASEELFRIRGQSMEPTLLSGDRVLVDAGSYEHQEPKRDDLVTVSMKSRQVQMVKRVDAVPGDAVNFHGDMLWINGKEFRKITLKKWRSTVKQIGFYGGVIPPDSFLLLGDNTVNSRDSGRLGLISRDQISGKVIQLVRKGD